MKQVGSLHAVMSDKEYNVSLNCALMNLCEQPTLPPSFRNSNSSAKDTIKLLADKVNMNSQVLLSRTVTMMAVELDYALLELCYGADKESPLAHVIVSLIFDYVFCAFSFFYVLIQCDISCFSIYYLSCSLKVSGYHTG